MTVSPYVVGQWVRGEHFYGRRALINEVLHGHRNCLWLLGIRRVGKTSILKQLEHLTTGGEEAGFFPLYWDFQGAEGPGDLDESFAESLLDTRDRLEDLQVPLTRVEGDDLLTSLGRLRRELRLKGRTLLLLGDEVEELITVAERAPRFLRRFRRALQSAEGIRTVLASSIRLWDLAYEQTTTSPFLHGFTPPLYVRGLEADAARSLIRQSQAPQEARPVLDDASVEEIRSRCDDHPFLLQLVGERFVELGDLAQAVEEIAADRMVSHFFAVDFEMLSERERDVIGVVADRGEATSASLQERLAVQSSSLRGSLQRLEHRGIVHRCAGGGHAVANSFFKRWLDELPGVQRDLLVRASTHQTLRTLVLVDEPERLIDGRYELLEELGKGATGQVYRAQDTLLGVETAVKVLKQEYCGDGEAMDRLRREVILSRDLSHPNIVKVYHLGDDRGLRYVTMQLVDGSDLADVLANESPLPVDRAVSLAGRLASALEAAHGCRVLHRDIKPSNILIDQSGEPLITDFGLARLVGGPGITRHGVFVGTPAYASPEQVQGEDLDERSDLYSLGVVIFEMVTGRRPFVADAVNQLLLMHVEDPPPPPGDLRPEVTPALSELILRLLAKDPAERHASAGDLVCALSACDS